MWRYQTKSEIGYSFKEALQFLRTFWPDQEICHTLRTCGNHPVIPTAREEREENTGGREGGRETHTHTWRETENTHRRRADCGSKLAQLSSPPHCSQMAFTLAEGERVLSNISSAWLAKSTGSRSLWARRTRLCCAQPRSGLRDGEKGTDMGWKTTFLKLLSLSLQPGESVKRSLYLLQVQFLWLQDCLC